MSNLKPCPMCGSGDITIYDLFNDQKQLGIECQGCHLCSRFCATLEEATSAWNNRTESVELAALREQVKVLREALEASVDLLSKLENIGGFIGLAVISNGQTVLGQTKPRDDE